MQIKDTLKQKRPNLRTAEFLYVRNFAPERWPMGSPRFESKADLPSAKALEKDTVVAFADMDASPTKAWLVGQYAEPEWEWHYHYAFGKRPAEELYGLRNDPDQTKNLASDPAFAAHKRDLSERLLHILAEAEDPRVTGDGQTFERPPFTDPQGDSGPKRDPAAGRKKKAR